MPTAIPLRVALDLETTGLQSESESIVEIGAIKFRGAEVIETFESFIDPHRLLPYRIQRLTHITPAMLIGAPSIAVVAPKLRTFLSDLPLVGHNIGFDAAFLRRVQIGDRNPLLDTFELASMLMPALTSYSLENVAEVLGLTAPVHHRALADAILSHEVFLALEGRIQALPDTELNALCALAPPIKLPMVALLRREQSARGLVPEPPRVQAGAMATLGGVLNAKLGVNPAVLGTAIATAGPAVAMPILPAAAMQHSPPGSAALIAPFVQDALDRHQIVMVQNRPEPERALDIIAPALAWAVSQGKRLVIATASPAGARSLIAGAIPAAMAASGTDTVRTQALLYEARDYLCLHRWYGPARQAPSLTGDTLRGLAKLTMWLHDTPTGARDEVNINPAEQMGWEVVRAGANFIELPGCTYRERGWCFAQRARAAAAAAHIVVTTHAALLGSQDQTVGSGQPAYVPPADGYVILDAHLLEERLQQQGSWTMEQEALLTEFDLLWQGEEGRSYGLLAQAAALIPGASSDQSSQQVERAQTAVKAFFAALTALAVEHHPGDQGGDYQGALRLDDEARALAAWGALGDAWSTLERRLTTVIETTTQAAQALRKTPGSESLGMELTAQGQRLRLWQRRGRESLAQPRDGFVYWVRMPQNMGRRGRSGAAQVEEIPALYGAPATIGTHVAAAMQGLGGGIVLAGTALAVDGHFAATLDRLGLPTSTPTLRVPVDFTDQTLVLIPSDAPEPNAPAFQKTLNDAIVQVVSALEGNTVVLLPSHTALRTTYAAIKPLIEAQDIMVLGQGIDGSLRQIWQNFRREARVVVLGAGNMWEGWESEGAQPRCLFIARLPMPALNDPLLAARAALYADAMQQFTVPQAALRLRLALNRLAWEQDRRNVVVLYDRRVQTKSYGPTILNTLPTVTQRDESLTMLGRAARDWLASTL